MILDYEGQSLSLLGDGDCGNYGMEMGNLLIRNREEWPCYDRLQGLQFKFSCLWMGNGLSLQPY